MDDEPSVSQVEDLAVKLNYRVEDNTMHVDSCPGARGAGLGSEW